MPTSGSTSTAHTFETLQTKHKWANKPWDKIDIPSFGRHLKKLPPKHQPAHIKCVHDLQPLGMTNFRQSKIRDPTLKKCPCCNEVDEDQTHFINCAANPKRTPSLAQLAKDLIGTDSHPFGITLATCTEHTLKGKISQSTFPLTSIRPADAKK